MKKKINNFKVPNGSFGSRAVIRPLPLQSKEIKIMTFRQLKQIIKNKN